MKRPIHNYFLKYSLNSLVNKMWKRNAHQNSLKVSLTKPLPTPKYSLQNSEKHINQTFENNETESKYFSAYKLTAHTFRSKRNTGLNRPTVWAVCNIEISISYWQIY